MLRYQRDLPRLPVPGLDEMCALHLELTRPLLGRREYAETRRAVAEFAEPGGAGHRLQGRLLEWSQTSARDNWLEPFWDDWYLCDDTPLVVNVSPGFALTGGDQPQIERAARLLAAALRLKALVDHEELEPDLDGGAPRCMREYARLFSATRVPGAVRDELRTYSESRHVVVVHDGRCFALDVLDAHGRACPVSELERALRQIVEDPRPAQPSPGVLTTDRRRSWAGVRERHLQGGELSDVVERAILVLVLETGSPPPHPRTGDAARLFLHGDARGRWFDKSIQLVVAANGIAGFCMEHSGFDGSTAVRLAELLVAFENEASTNSGRHGGVAPRLLRYEPTEPVREAIESAERDADALLSRTDLVVFDAADLGKRTIVRHGVSPDGFVQMAFQLAYFTLTGETASTYESVDTKRFLHGRTEAMRSVSDESVAFVRSLRGRRRSNTAAAQLLRAAIERHATRLARCKEGRGVDRHLLGLRRMVEPDEETPHLFTDAGYTTLTRSVLSTSALPSSPGVALSCFGPVVDEGFGLSYTIHDDSVVCVVTNFDGLANDFSMELERSLEEMDALLA
jgi:carnitine O-acetyltransferase